MNRVLIDTDIIIDFFYKREPFAHNAAEIFSLCESKEIQGFVTSVIISNVYYILRKTASHEKVIESIKTLLLITEVLIIDKNVIYQAIFSDFRDFEVALQNFAAVNNRNIDLILTRNFKDFKNSTLAVMTPENYLVIKGSKY